MDKGKDLKAPKRKSVGKHPRHCSGQECHEWEWTFLWIMAEVLLLPLPWPWIGVWCKSSSSKSSSSSGSSSGSDTPMSSSPHQDSRPWLVTSDPMGSARCHQCHHGRGFPLISVTAQHRALAGDKPQCWGRATALPRTAVRQRSRSFLHARVTVPSVYCGEQLQSAAPYTQTFQLNLTESTGQLSWQLRAQSRLLELGPSNRDLHSPLCFPKVFVEISGSSFAVTSSHLAARAGRQDRRM